MCDIMEQYNQEAVDKEIKQRIVKMAKKGFQIKDIADIYDKTVDEIESILDSSED
jgi:SOS response regulatory protein OraA/RecX